MTSSRPLKTPQPKKHDFFTSLENATAKKKHDFFTSFEHDKPFLLDTAPTVNKI